PYSAAKVELGRFLYFDTRLSSDATISCASCHAPEKAFADGNPVSTGIGGQKGGRSAPTVINRAYSTQQFWEGRAPSLDEQANAYTTVECKDYSGNTPYDCKNDGDKKAMSASQVRGMYVFFNKAACDSCHLGFNFTDGSYVNIGIGMDKPKPDLGRFMVSKKE